MLSKPGTPEERFDQLYRKTSDDVLAYLIRRSRSSEDAADALAETYAAAWRKLNSLPAGDHTRLWLFGAARNELRKTASRLQADDDLNATLTNEAGPLGSPSQTRMTVTTRCVTPSRRCLGSTRRSSP